MWKSLNQRQKVNKYLKIKHNVMHDTILKVDIMTG